jgi:hypothetical protein
MTLLRATSTLLLSSGLPNDVVSNTTYWQYTTSSASDAYDEISARIEAAYADISTYLSVAVSRNVGSSEITMYDMADTEPRVPVREDTFTLGGAESAGLMPTEVALVLSFHGPFASGVANARRRGRLYLGPWTLERCDYRPDSTLIGACIDFGETLSTNIGAADVLWSQHSPTASTEFAVVGGWVDDAWDTQRRRGYEPATRTTFTV